jgi:hypothetical protein
MSAKKSKLQTLKASNAQTLLQKVCLHAGYSIGGKQRVDDGCNLQLLLLHSYNSKDTLVTT